MCHEVEGKYVVMQIPHSRAAAIMPAMDDNGDLSIYRSFSPGIQEWRKEFKRQARSRCENGVEMPISSGAKPA